MAMTGLSIKLNDCCSCSFTLPTVVLFYSAWDSGDPVIWAGQNAEEDVLVALGSTGIGCADPFFPAIQARLATEHGYGYQWIREQVCRLSKDPPEDFDCPQLEIERKPRASSSTKSKPTVHHRTSSRSSSSSSSAVIGGESMVNLSKSGTEFFTADSVSVGCLLVVMFLVAQLWSWRKQRNNRQARVQQVMLRSPSGQNLVGYGSLEC
jgi:hypothetical protein